MNANSNTNANAPSSPLLSGLNDRQREAVTLPHQSALILAGAGSGKTRVLTTRIAWLIQTGQVSPGGLLAVTFTNKAAREMFTRLSAMLPINTRGMWIGTFHGLCNRLLRAHHRDAGLPALFQILDMQDQQALIKRIMKAANIDDERYPPREVGWYINGNKEEGRRAADAEAYDDISKRKREIYALYEEQCNREGVVDFAELLLRSYELLMRNEPLRKHYQERFRHILVDEFQDTNRLQYRWLKLLAGPDSAIFAVGDDDQSIYAFRGASASNMLELQRDFHVERVIKLEQNYRSHGNILDAANALIAHNRKRLGKELWTAEGKGEQIRVYEAATDFEEAGFIVDEVKALRNAGLPLADIALLYRSNAQSRVLEHALFNAGLPYRVYGGLRFFERQEIKHALAYLRVIASDEDDGTSASSEQGSRLRDANVRESDSAPSSANVNSGVASASAQAPISSTDGALLRIINFPTRGIGARTQEQLVDAAKKANRSLWQTAVDAVGSDPQKGKGLAGFVALIQEMRAATQGLALPEIIEHMIEHSGLKLHYETEKEGKDRLENLDELVSAAAAFVHDEQQADTSLAGFLAHASLEAGDNQAEAGADALQLMTVHAAKGLEFHAVFLSGLEEGLFPHENSLNENEGIEEERRLMYVAITRARRRLYMSFAQSRMLHGQTRYGIASSFLHEMPEALFKRINPMLTASLHMPRPTASRGDGNSYGNGGYGNNYSKNYAPHAAQPTAPPKIQQPDPASPWRIGQNVTHPKFGNGVIVNAEGRGADARVQINFRTSGTKWLALEIVKDKLVAV